MVDCNYIHIVNLDKDQWAVNVCGVTLPESSNSKSFGSISSRGKTVAKCVAEEQAV